MDLALLTDPTRCPDCTAVLPETPVCCPACQLPLRGPLVDRLWRLSLQAADTLGQRQSVIVALHDRQATAPTGAENLGWGGASGSPASMAPPAPHAPVASPETLWAFPGPIESTSREPVTVRQIQRLLLSLGVLLLAVAAVIFTVVAWGRVGIGGRTAILGGLTVAGALGARLAHRRELPGTAEALATLTLGLCLLDAYGIRQYDLAGTGGTSADTYWATVFGVLAVAAAAAHLVLPLRTLRYAAVIGLQLPLPTLGDRLGHVTLTVALLLQGTAAMAGSQLLLRTRARFLLLAGGAFAYIGSAINIAVLAYGDDADGPRVTALQGSGLLLLVAATAAALAWVLRKTEGAAVLGTGVATAAVLAAGHAPMHRAWEPEAATTGAAALMLAGVVALLAVPRLSAAWRNGPLATLGLAGLGALLAVAEPLARALGGPIHWLDDPWSQALGADAREVLGTPWPHHGIVVVTLALLALATAVVGVRLRADAVGTPAGVLTGALVTATAIVLPVATNAPYLLAVLGLVAVGGTLVVTASRIAAAPSDDEASAEEAVPAGGPTWSDGAGWEPDRRTLLALGLAAAGLVAAGLGLVWSLAAQAATPMALGAVLVAALAVRALGAREGFRLAATAVAALAAITETGVLTAIAGQAQERAGTAAVLAAGVLAVAAGLLPRARERATLEVASLCGAVAAFAAIAESAQWSWIALLVAGCAAALVGLRPDRHQVGWLAGLLFTTSSWIRLAMADVDTPEAYTTGPALALLIVGWFARRHDDELDSWRAYGAGLTLGLLPSLAMVLDDDGLTRPLLLGGAALAIVLVGVVARLQAPLVVGGTVLAIDAVVQLAPYADAVPRWVAIGGAGLLLLALGVTFERRLRDLRLVTAKLAGLS